MHAHHLSMHLVRRLAPHRLAAGALVTLAMLSAACSNDSASRINAPPLLSSMDKGHTPGGVRGVRAVTGCGVGLRAPECSAFEWGRGDLYQHPPHPHYHRKRRLLRGHGLGH